MSEKEDDEDRSMRLLQPKLRILYFLNKQGKFINNKSEISRRLKYAGDSNVNTYINELINESYIKVVNKGDTEFLKLTQKGLNKILPLILPDYAILLIITLSFSNVIWALNKMIYSIPIDPYLVIIVNTLAILSTILLRIMQKRVEKQSFHV